MVKYLLTIQFMGIWKQIYNIINVTEFGSIKKMTPTRNFDQISSKWISKTNAIGIYPPRTQFISQIWLTPHKHPIVNSYRL